MCANFLFSKTFQDFSSIFVLFWEIDSLFFILKAERICYFLIQVVFLIRISKFRVFILVGQYGCTQFNGHNLVYSQDRHVDASPEWPSEWLIELMNAQGFITIAEPVCNPPVLSVWKELIGYTTTNPDPWAKGKVSRPCQQGQICLLKHCVSANHDPLTWPIQVE